MQVEEQARECLCILDLVQPGRDLARRPAHDFQLLVRLRARPAPFEAVGDEEMHPFAAEPGRRVEGGELTPRASGEPCLLLELAARTVAPTYPVLACARGKFEQVFARGFASLPHERQHAL